MKKYIKNPIPIEAIQFLDDSNQLALISDFVGVTIKVDYKITPPVLTIGLANRKELANLGDWIMKGVKGEIYVCPKDVFELSYTESTI